MEDYGLCKHCGENPGRFTERMPSGELVYLCKGCFQIFSELLQKRIAKEPGCRTITGKVNGVR